MRAGLLELLRCPRCRADRSFRCSATEQSEREIVTGSLECEHCGQLASIQRGVVDLLPDPEETVRLEAAGLERFAEVMRADGWDRERVLALPDGDGEYWLGQRMAVDRLLELVDPPAGASLLDVGANTCWASNLFAQRGLDVIALDITTTELQGLHTAEWWFEANGVHFERILSTMVEPAIASGSLDYVFCSVVLHHNRKPELHRTLAELHRVLKPGGVLMVTSEPLRFLTDLKRDHGDEVAEYEGNENVYFAWEYIRAARRAGFAVEALVPDWPTLTGAPLAAEPGASAAARAKVRLLDLVRRSRLGMGMLHRKAMLFGPDHTLSLLCRKAA